MSGEYFYCAHCGATWLGKRYSECPRCSDKAADGETELTRLRAENDTLRVERSELRRELEDARGQVVALRGALTKEMCYGSHATDCPFIDQGLKPCNCGLCDVRDASYNALSTPAPAVVPLEKIRPLVEALRFYRNCVWIDFTTGTNVEVEELRKDGGAKAQEALAHARELGLP